jgi:hypothetical protein
MAVMAGRRRVITLYIDPPVLKRLSDLSHGTRIPRAVLVREAVDDLLRKYAAELRGKAKR